MKRIGAATIMTCAALTGCVTIPGKMLPKVNEFPVVTEKTSVNISARYQNFTQNQSVSIDEYYSTKVQGKLVERFQQSKLFSEVTTANEHSDISLDVNFCSEEVMPSGRSNKKFIQDMLISVNTMSIPVKTIYTASAKVTNHKNGSEKTIVLQDYSTTWFNVLSLVGMPLVVPRGNQDDAINLIDTLAILVYESTMSGATSTTPPSNLQFASPCAPQFM